jgi:hypothetical protein
MLTGTTWNDTLDAVASAGAQNLKTTMRRQSEADESGENLGRLVK